MGIKGIKVDFFNSETQQTLKLMDSITQESAELKLLVNFHGCVKPTGERRTWPNIITREAVYGNEHFLSGENWGPTAEGYSVCQISLKYMKIVRLVNYLKAFLLFGMKRSSYQEILEKVPQL